MGWPSATVAPSSTSHSVRVPSCIEKPILGTSTSVVMLFSPVWLGSSAGQFSVLRIAAITLSASGMKAFSRGFEYGTAELGAPTRCTGARSWPDRSSWIAAARSAERRVGTEDKEGRARDGDYDRQRHR